MKIEIELLTRISFNVGRGFNNSFHTITGSLFVHI